MAGRPNARKAYSTVEDGAKLSRGMKVLDAGMGTPDHTTDKPGQTMPEGEGFAAILGKLGPLIGGLTQAVDTLMAKNPDGSVRVDRPNDPGFGGGSVGEPMGGGETYQDAQYRFAQREAFRDQPSTVKTQDDVTQMDNNPEKTPTPDKPGADVSTKQPAPPAEPANNTATRFVGIWDDRESTWSVGSKTMPQPSLLDPDKYEIVEGDTARTNYVYEKVPAPGGPQVEAPAEEAENPIPKDNQAAFEQFPFMKMPNFNLLGQQGDTPSVPKTQTQEFNSFFDIFKNIFEDKFNNPDDKDAKKS
jgi:hypothetical protein